MLNFLFQRNKSQFTDLWQASTDIHAHLLPGVDDGSQSADESMEILSFLHAKGVEHMFLTPHIMADYPQNCSGFLQEQFVGFTQCCEGVSIPRLRLAAEYMLDEQFVKHLEQGLLTYDGKHVLVEMSCMQAPMNLYDKLYSLQLNGYTPILAHPERYLFMSADGFARLKEHGCEFQLNLFSLTGFYGESARSNAVRLLKKGMYDYVGSDIHSLDYKASYSNMRLKEKEAEAVHVLMKKNASLWIG